MSRDELGEWTVQSDPNSRTDADDEALGKKVDKKATNRPERSGGSSSRGKDRLRKRAISHPLFKNVMFEKS